MTIAIDIDDTLARFQKGFLMYFNKLTGSTIKESDINSYDFYVKSLPDLSRKEIFQKMIAFYDTDEFKNLEPLKYSQETVKKLAEDNTLYVVTSRPDYISIPSIMWLEEHYPSIFNDYFFTNQFGAKPNAHVQTKSEVCKKLDASILIEDSFAHATEAIENGFRAILINKPWNIEEKNKEIERVNNWEDIKKLILV